MKRILTPLVSLAAIAIMAQGALAADVKENWDKNCLKCHGKDGTGNTKMGRQAGVKDYSDAKVQAEMKDENAIKAIKEGIKDKGKEKMKAYADQLNDEDIKALIAYMRAFKK